MKNKNINNQNNIVGLFLFFDNFILIFCHNYCSNLIVRKLAPFLIYSLYRLFGLSYFFVCIDSYKKKISFSKCQFYGFALLRLNYFLNIKNVISFFYFTFFRQSISLTSHNRVFQVHIYPEFIFKSFFVHLFFVILSFICK